MKGERRTDVNVIERIKAVNNDRIDLDDAIELYALGGIVKTTYDGNQLEAPEALRDGLDGLGKLIKTKRRENLERALKETKARRAALSTAEEKRGREDAEVTRLEKLLETA